MSGQDGFGPGPDPQQVPRTDERMLADRYVLGEPLGRGRTGTVWRARDVVLDREVAVKEVTVAGLPPDQLAEVYSHLRNAALATARIEHPDVVTVYEVLEQDGRPWIVMELIDGRSLAAVLSAEGTLRPRDAARLGLSVLAGLSQAHQVGLLHGDVNPSAILLARDGRIVLTDFGIAAADSGADLTSSGSAEYLAPERITGRPPSPESDLWSLGVTLYTAVEGRSPFLRGTVAETEQAVVGDPLPQPQRAGALTPVLDALLRKNPHERPSDAQVQGMLDDVAAGRSIGGDTWVIAPSTAPGGVTAGAAVGGVPAGAAASGARAGATARAAGDSRKRSQRTRMLLAGISLLVAVAGGATAVVRLVGSSHNTPSTTSSASPALTETQPTDQSPFAPPAAAPTTSSTSASPSASSSASASSSPSASSGNGGAAAPGLPASPKPSPSTTAPATSSPEQVVVDYFAAINAHDYARAWSLGGKNLGGSFNSFANGFADTAHDSVTVTAAVGNTVLIQLDATQTNGTHRYFAGTYVVRNGQIVSAHVTAG